MLTREKNIVEASSAVFLRYGVKRATMNDIASEAGISRQTLYNAFKNKDEILRALIRHYAMDAVSLIRQEAKQKEGLSEKLDSVFHHMTIKPFELLHSSPNAEEILDGINGPARDALLETQVLYEEVIAEILAPYEDGFSSVGLSVADVAVHIFSSAKGIKHHARNKVHLAYMLNVLKITVINMVEG